LLEWARTAAAVVHAPSCGEADSVAAFCPGSPVPEHVRLYVCAVAFCSITVKEPDAAIVPDQAPLPVQELASVLVQVSVALWPGMTALGLIERLTVAFGPGCEAVIVVGDLLQPERTKVEKRRNNKTKERDFPVSEDTFIKPPFACALWSHVELTRSNTE
jgi:hypothetical protein